MSQPVNTIEAKNVEDKLNNEENLSIIDVREDEEVAAGMIPGAAHIKLSDIPERYTDLDPEKEYILVCRSGRRSEKAAEFLQDQGLKVKNMTGGMLKWEGRIE